MALKVQVMDNLSLLSAVLEDVILAVDNIKAHYKNIGDSAKLHAIGF